MSASDKRTFATDYETDSITNYTQPAFGMSFLSMALGYFVSCNVEQFMPKRLVDKRLANGVRVRNLFPAPYLLVGSFYVAVAATLARGMDVAGHFGGLTVSTVAGLAFASQYKTTWYYTIIGAGYLGYGLLHHYRKLMILTDNAPLYEKGDFSEIWREIKRKRRSRVSGPEPNPSS